MNIGKTRIDAGAISFAIQHRDLDGGAPHGQGAGSAGGSYADQGVCIQVMADVDGKDTEILRFDCFDNSPHYHYGPEKDNVRILLDTVITGNPIGWTTRQLRGRLPEMIKRAGYEELAGQLDDGLVSEKVDELDTVAREMAARERHTVTHNRGTEVIEAGNIRFGLEMRTAGEDGGLANHVLSDVAGQEIELMAIDCFRISPHYHYGPRAKNERNFMDTTLVPDSFEWILDQFKGGKLPDMLEYAGYPTIVAAMDEDLLAERLVEVESKGRAMIANDPR